MSETTSESGPSKALTMASTLGIAIKTVILRSTTRSRSWPPKPDEDEIEAARLNLRYLRHLANIFMHDRVAYGQAEMLVDIMTMPNLAEVKRPDILFQPLLDDLERHVQRTPSHLSQFEPWWRRWHSTLYYSFHTKPLPYTGHGKYLGPRLGMMFLLGFLLMTLGKWNEAAKLWFNWFAESAQCCDLQRINIWKLKRCPRIVGFEKARYLFGLCLLHERDPSLVQGKFESMINRDDPTYIDAPLDWNLTDRIVRERLGVIWPCYRGLDDRTIGSSDRPCLEKGVLLGSSAV